jgi:hypothetical protein
MNLQIKGYQSYFPLISDIIICKFWVTKKLFPFVDIIFLQVPGYQKVFPLNCWHRSFCDIKCVLASYHDGHSNSGYHPIGNDKHLYPLKTYSTSQWSIHPSIHPSSIHPSMFYLSSAATIPATGVDSRRPDLLTLDFHSALFHGSLSVRLCVHKSSFKHCDQVFLGRPRFPEQGIFMLVIVLMQAEEHIMYPYHLLSRLERRASVTSCIPNLAQSNVVGVSSPSLVRQIQRIITLSFLQSLCRSPAVRTHVYFSFQAAMQSVRMHRMLYP